MKGSEDCKRRILCIDGGGILGVFPAAFLAGLEQHMGDRPIGEHFDLIAGTSTGGIIAIGLAMGLRASDLLSLYEKWGPEIFGQENGPIRNSFTRWYRTALHLARYKHSQAPLRRALEEVIGARRIGDAKTRLLIPAWNPTSRSVYIYKTAHHERLRTDYTASAVDAAMATAAAPTYFSHHVTKDAVGLSDGGTWANNPIALAVVEAIGLLRWSPDSLNILSLGCLEEAYTVRKWAGIGTLGTKVIKLFMDGQSHGAMGMAKLLTGHEHDRTAIHRVNHVVPSGEYAMDDPHLIQDLKGLGHSFARDRYPVLESIFFRSAAPPFVPTYTLDRHLSEAGVPA